MVFRFQVRLHDVGDGVWSAVTTECKRCVEDVRDATTICGIDGLSVDLAFLAPFSLDEVIGENAYIETVVAFNARIRNQNQTCYTVENVFQGVSFVIVCFSRKDACLYYVRRDFLRIARY